MPSWMLVRAAGKVIHDRRSTGSSPVTAVLTVTCIQPLGWPTRLAAARTAASSVSVPSASCSAVQPQMVTAVSSIDTSRVSESPSRTLKS
jgi:hypothetical protein